MTTFVLADGHPLILFALKTLLSFEADFTVLAECSDGDEALWLLQKHSPDVLVLDKDLPGKDGLMVLRELHELKSTTLVVLLAQAEDGEMLLDAVRWGVRGIVLVDMVLQLLVPCIRKVVAGGEWLEWVSVRSVLDRVLQGGAEVKPILDQLSSHEAKLMRLVSEGHSNKVIAKLIDSSEGAVKAYLHRIYQKLGVRGRMDLARLVIEKDLMAKEHPHQHK